MPQPSFQKQQPLTIALVVIVLLIAGLVYKNYFQAGQGGEETQPFSSVEPIVPVPVLPQDLFANNAFLNLQTYQPVVAPQVSNRPNPFAAP